MKKGKGIIPDDTRYVPLTQQPSCCVPTCFQIIMLKHNIPLQSAELMAYHMKVIVSPESKTLFWNLPSTKKRPSWGYGTQLNENLTANPMFRKLNIPLTMSWRLIDRFDSDKDMTKYMITSIKNDNDVIVCFDYGTLFNTNYNGGHVCVIDKIYPRKNEVRFIDPVATAPKWRTVKISKLIKAMKVHGAEKMGGFWEIDKI